MGLNVIFLKGWQMNATFGKITYRKLLIVDFIKYDLTRRSIWHNSLANRQIARFSAGLDLNPAVVNSAISNKDIDFRIAPPCLSGFNYERTLTFYRLFAKWDFWQFLYFGQLFWDTLRKDRGPQNGDLSILDPIQVLDPNPKSDFLRSNMQTELIYRSLYRSWPIDDAENLTTH